MGNSLNTRAIAAKLSWQIIDGGQSLDTATGSALDNADMSPQDRGFVQELVYGICRWYGELDTIAGQLLKSPIRKKDRIVHFVLLTGLYQLRHISTADHAAVAETVSACQQLNKVWAKNVINGCLRNYLRHYLRNNPRNHPENPSELPERELPELKLPEPAAALSHPNWIRAAISSAWPNQAPDILHANNQYPPMCIRVNRRQHSRDDYLARLRQNEINAYLDPYAIDGIILEQPVAVSMLPDFNSGACSVQDTAAQLAADFLHINSNMTVLDACAAPGGKTAHLLERTNNEIEMDALDISERRIQQLNGTLARLCCSANVMVADACVAGSWPAPAVGYDRILIDAPCSGLGVIRRHPDIKHHRRPDDIHTLTRIQQQLLHSLWPNLKPHGLLLYITCSILPAENEAQIRQFVTSQNDAMLLEINHPNAIPLELGVQTLPGIHNMDGFYYCLLKKSAP